jgi:hypothetical protein
MGGREGGWWEKWNIKGGKYYRKRKKDEKEKQCCWYGSASNFPSPRSGIRMRIRIQLFEHWRQKRQVFRYNYIQTVKATSTKSKLKYSKGAKTSPCFLRIITERSLIMVFWSPLLTKSLNPDPDWDFCLDPNPEKKKKKKRMRIRNTLEKVR